jgi:hypothetical protein
MVSWVSFTSELPGEELVRFLWKQVSPVKIGLKVPKCEIFDPFFYTNKSYMGR